MKQKVLNSPVPILAIICLLLLFDGTGLVRMALIASLIHESGHCLVYFIQIKKIPPLRLSLSGIGLQIDTLYQSREKQTWLLLGGCIANFLACGVLLVLIDSKATYGRYFFLAANLFVGCYNLLPIGILDGARLLNLWLPDKFSGLSQKMDIFISVILLLWVVVKLVKKKMPIWIGVTLIATFWALIWQSKNQIK